VQVAGAITARWMLDRDRETHRMIRDRAKIPDPILVYACGKSVEHLDGGVQTWSHETVRGTGDRLDVPLSLWVARRGLVGGIVVVMPRKRKSRCFFPR
jgi:hypothetical protein